MPSVNISLRTGSTPEYRRAIADGVHEAMMEALDIPLDDRFELIQEFLPENVHQHPSFFGIERSTDSIFIQIVLNARPVEEKQTLYLNIAQNLAREPGVRKEDIFICILEVARENWWAYARVVDETGSDARRTSPKRA